MGYTIIVLSGVYDVESENYSKLSGHMTSGERVVTSELPSSFHMDKGGEL